MGDQQNITQILAALAAARPGGQTGGFPGTIPTSTPPGDATGYSIPPPDSTGNFDLSGARPVNTGSVNISDAIAKARGYAAEKGIAHDANRGPSHNEESLRGSRSYRRSRSPSRSPTRPRRDVFRDNYNPYRDERRGEKHPGGMRERSFSPRPGGRRPDAYRDPTDQSSPGRRGAPPGGDDNVETLSMDSRLVGLVIGRQGETLRAVEADTGTRVQFLDCPEPQTRLCRITGPKMARDDAKTEINRIVRENATTSRPPVGLTEWPPRDSSASQSDEKFVQIMVPDRTVGLIIGRGGETIKDLQERSGCHVNIQDKSVNGLRPVNLTGPVRATERAKDLILEIVESDTRQQHGNQHQQQQPPPPAPQRDSRGHGYGGDSYGGPGEKLNESFFVPKEAVGMIIGKGGEAIKEMQAMTGCRVNILPPSGRDGEREVTLQGSRTAIDQATQNILEKVDAAKNRPQASRREEPYNDRYSNYQAQPYSQAPPNTSSQQSPPQGGTGDSSDPYAVYGGYENYCAMWYTAMAQQQQQYQQQYQQSGHESTERSGPPGHP